MMQPENLPQASISKPERIGVVAKLIGVTTRTLRYWQEIGLLTPHGSHEAEERLYLPSDYSRAAHILELQQLFGFTLAEIRSILEAEDHLANIKLAYDPDAPMATLQHLREESLMTIQSLITQIDTKMERIAQYRASLALKANHIEAKIKGSDNKT